MKSRAHILIVDDEQLLRKMLRDILLREGYGTIDEATDGEAALAKLAKRHYDIVITDIRMPNKSGIELLVESKKLYPTVSIIVMTGYGDIHTPEEAKRLGADEYVTKPLKASEIEVIVERVRLRQIVANKQPEVAVPATA